MSAQRYDIDWQRPQDPDEVFTCKGLSERQLVRRLLGAVSNFGQVTVVDVRHSK